MGLRPTHRDESHNRCRPRVSGDPCQVDSRFRGNDVTFDGVSLPLQFQACGRNLFEVPA
jgi:hypothetical protein